MGTLPPTPTPTYCCVLPHQQTSSGLTLFSVGDWTVCFVWKTIILLPNWLIMGRIFCFWEVWCACCFHGEHVTHSTGTDMFKHFWKHFSGVVSIPNPTAVPTASDKPVLPCFGAVIPVPTMPSSPVTRYLPQVFPLVN